ncbi:glycosyltransferase family 2 protein [Spirosoma agri]|uniref:Glycosyltransferase family 2 protein n=2 Tax=Spirosoma agri TaxID=1987381 RepID=A0A6M0ILV9_9BACT|nr:glycosyltransferase family 2 protein [Spirosoma agri]
MSFISICMATYNGSQFIEQQLISILQQLDEDDEIIISDDGSTDDTLEIIKQFSDQRIKIFINANIHGPTGNFENALEHCSGRYIFLADQDDIWLPDKVAVISNLLIDYDLVLTDCEVVNQMGHQIHSSFFEHRGSRKGFWTNLYKNSYIGCCMAFRRDILQYILPFPKQIHMHDWWIGLLVEAKGKTIFYKKPLIKYVRHGGNASPTGETGYSFAKQLLNRLFLFFNVAKRLLA